MDLPWLYGKVYQNWSRSSGQKRWAGRRIGWFGAGRGNRQDLRPLKANGNKIILTRSKQAKAKTGGNKKSKGGKGQSVAATGQHQKSSK